MSEDMVTNQGAGSSSHIMALSLSAAAGAAIGFAVGYAWWWVSGLWTELGWGAVCMALGAGVGLMICHRAGKKTA